MLPVANTAGMIEHLRLISQATAKDRQALVIVDRAGWHMTKAIRCFSNVTLLPLPPYSPELNPVEQLWQQIKQRFLSIPHSKIMMILLKDLVRLGMKY
ncbi:hypothetical protein BSPWISOXPB_7195 [uncultured Gammaproteobacteria bacterium]|nr:hypothetical protein BSPWISOXPB_1565 [uncultured Gammaproteobacteria bacterium]VVM20610.1 hypothetical protein BSPWISOXPB_7195 [uncultured Gammaproteobacteria bacterium]